MFPFGWVGAPGSNCPSDVDLQSLVVSTDVGIIINK